MSDFPTLDSKGAYSKNVLLSEGIVVIEGTATWCPQCKVIAPELPKIASEFPDVKWYTYDTEGVPDIAQELGVSQMPTFSIFKDGDIEGSVTGAKVKELREKLKTVSEGGRI